MGKARPYWECHAIIEGELLKECSICEQWFPCDEDNFYPNKSNKSDGFNPYCIECTKIKSDKWKKDNPERYKELMQKENSKQSSKDRHNYWSEQRRLSGAYKEWQQSKSGKESMKKSRVKREIKKHDITDLELAILYNYCDSKCMYCGVSEEENKKLHGQILSKDHAVNTGSNGIDNCILCCKSCSSSKHSKDWMDWYTPDNPRYSVERHNNIVVWLNKNKHPI